MEIFILCILISFVVGDRILEGTRLKRHREQIPIRIHVNGSRGKSSVTRLIAGALRGGGISAIAKTTGTTPRIIYEDGSETPLYRLGKANIKEQFHVLGLAAQRNPDAIVIECMALQPRLQAMSEHRIIHSTIGVITNCREDHLDVMGPTERHVAQALAGTTPAGQTLVTAESQHLDILKHACQELECNLEVVATDDLEAISNAEMARFGYYEHRENVAVALRVAKLCGVSREDAMVGMLNATPDVGALRMYDLEFFGRQICFVHGFAANDPQSSHHIWELSHRVFPEYSRRIMLLNLRTDRGDRSRQLGEAITTWATQPDFVVLMGTGTRIAARELLKKGFLPGQIVFSEGTSARDVFERIVELVDQRALVVGLGNVADPGLALVGLFRNRGVQIPMSQLYPTTPPEAQPPEVANG
ncbi:MAG: poly-gamma-glutamate synthase PgsB [Myxococcales bacterium]|nr:poly-gamma-glutamate synthase PgsB [Myxococcales bacterium]